MAAKTSKPLWRKVHDVTCPGHYKIPPFQWVCPVCRSDRKKVQVQPKS